jgi:hypothetical protein
MRLRKNLPEAVAQFLVGFFEIGQSRGNVVSFYASSLLFPMFLMKYHRSL